MNNVVKESKPPPIRDLKHHVAVISQSLPFDCMQKNIKQTTIAQYFTENEEMFKDQATRKTLHKFSGYCYIAYG